MFTDEPTNSSQSDDLKAAVQASATFEIADAVDRVSATIEVEAAKANRNNTFLCIAMLSGARVVQLGLAGKHREAGDLFKGVLSRFADFTEDQLKCDGMQDGD